MSTAQAHTPISITRTKEYLKTMIDPKRERHSTMRLVPMLWGKPGMAKSSAVYQVGSELGFEGVVEIRAAELRAEDFGGVPLPYSEGFTRFHPPEAIFKLTKKYLEQERAKWVADGKKAEDFKAPGPRILFLDELPNAAPETQAPLHAAVLRHVIGVDDLELQDNVYIVAAGNEEEHGAFVNDLGAPLANRMVHYHVELQIEEWVSYQRAQGAHPAVLSFVPQNEQLFHNYDPQSKSKTFASPRSWELASELLYAFDGADDPSFTALRPNIQGAVGTEAATSFLTWYGKTRNAPTAEQIAKDPEGTEVFSKDNDIAIVVVENMINGARRKPEWVVPFVTYAARIHAQHQEILIPELLGVNGPMDPATIQAMLKLPKEQFVRMQQIAARVTGAVKKADAVVKPKTRKN